MAGVQGMQPPVLGLVERDRRDAADAETRGNVGLDDPQIGGCQHYPRRQGSGLEGGLNLGSLVEGEIVRHRGIPGDHRQIEALHAQQGVVRRSDHAPVPISPESMTSSPNNPMTSAERQSVVCLRRANSASALGLHDGCSDAPSTAGSSSGARAIQDAGIKVE